MFTNGVSQILNLQRKAWKLWKFTNIKPFAKKAMKIVVLYEENI